MNLAAIVLWTFLCLLIGWLGFVLWFTYRDTRAELSAKRRSR